jgi:hypothetical protein
MSEIHDILIPVSPGFPMERLEKPCWVVDPSRHFWHSTGRQLIPTIDPQGKSVIPTGCLAARYLTAQYGTIRDDGQGI